MRLTLPRLGAALLCCALAAPVATHAAGDAFAFDVHANQTYASMSGRDLD
jgi:hypothetical protein